MILPAVIMLLISTVSLQNGSAKDAVDSFDARAFEELDPQQRVDFVLAALQWRDSHLQNFSYNLTETVSLIESGDARQEAFQVRRIAFACSGAKNLLHVHESSRGKHTFEFWTSWDGQTRRSRNQRPGASPSGTIADSEHPAVLNTSYNRVLGYRWDAYLEGGVLAPMPLPAWLEHETQARQRRTEVHVDGEAAKELISIKVSSPAGASDYYDRFWIDPRRDFMLVREEHVLSTGDDFSYSRSEVLKSKEIDGLWVPFKVHQARSISQRDQGRAEYEWDVSSFARGTVREEDLRVDYPPGSLVVDLVKRAAYRVSDSGRWNPVPLYDPKTGIETVAGETAQEVFAQAADPFGSRPRGWLRAIIGGGIVALAAIGSVAIIVRRRLARS